MSQKKIIAVFGATGAQGGGLAHAILNDPNSEFSVRAITRDVNSDNAKALAKLGAEVVSANIDDYASIVNALKGAYGAFFVTFFWAHYSAEAETNQAKNFAKAAKEAGIEHAVWSTLDDTRKFIPLDDNRMPTIHGKYKVPHFDGKGEGDEFFKQYGVPTTNLLTTFYWDNMLHFGMGPKKGPDGKLALTFPMGQEQLPGIAAEDIGKCAYGIFKKGKSMIGQTIGIAGDNPTVSQMASVLSKTKGREIVYNEITPDTYRSFGFPGADDLGNMFQFYRDFSEFFVKSRDVKMSRELNPQLKSFETWAKENNDKIQIED